MAVLHQRAFLEPFVKNDDLDLDDQEIQKTMITIVQKRPSQLTEELKLIIQHIIQEEASKKTTNQIETVTNMVITEDTPWVNSLCYIVEQILYHGLKDVSFFGITECWHYIEQLPTCMPGSDHILNIVRDLTKSSLGRGRLFVRVALNEGSLHEYLSALKWNEPLTKKYYHDLSIIRNEEHCGTFFMLVDQLSVVKFSLYLKIKEIGREEYWDIIPLARPQIIVNDRLKDPQKGILQVKAKKVEPVVPSEQADTENSTSSLSSLTASHSLEDDLDEIIDKSLRTSQPKQALQDSRKMEEEQKAKEEASRKQEAEELKKKKEQERIKQEATKKQEEEERIKAEIKKEEERRKQAEEISQAMEAKRRQQQEDDRIKEEQRIKQEEEKRKEEEEERQRKEEQRKRQQEEELKRREEQHRLEQEKIRLEEEERQRLEAEERIKEQQRMEEEKRLRQESSKQDSSDQAVETDNTVISQPTEDATQQLEDQTLQQDYDREILEEASVQEDQAAVEEERSREEERIRQEQHAQELEEERKRKQQEEARRAMEEEQARIREEQMKQQQEEEITKALLEQERKMREEHERQEAARRALEEEQARIREEQIKQQEEEERRRQEELRLKEEEERVKQEEIRKSRELEQQRALEAQKEEEERIKKEEEERTKQIQEEQKAAEDAEQKAEPTRIQRIENIVLPTHDDVVAVQRNPSKKKGKRVRIKSKPAAVMPNMEIPPQAEPDNEAITSMEKDLQQHHQSIDEMLSTLKNLSSSLKVTSPITEEEPQPTETVPEQVPQEEESDEASSDDDSIDEEDYADIDFTQPIPQEWREFTNNDGKKYYYNIYSRVTIWYHPLIYIKKHGLTSIKYEPAVPKEEKVPETTVQDIKAPTVRPPWMPDKSVEACMNCKNKFSLKLRKHHCRSCGQIYCSACCVKIPLPNLRYTKPELVCEKCFKTYYSGTAV